MLELLKAVFFGIVEGITEWLPISSTGHLILLNEFIRLDVSEEFFSMFEVVIQLGAIFAVVVLFWKEIWPFSAKEKYYIRQDTFVMWFKIVVACIPAAVVELGFGDVIEELFYNYLVIALALIVFGVAFIWIENRNKTKSPKMQSIAEITWMTAFWIGMFQVIAAVFPGTSRSGATIRRDFAWRFQRDCGRIYVFSGNPGDVWRKPDEAVKIRAYVYFRGIFDSADRNGDGFFGIAGCHPVFDGVYQKARF